MERIRLIATDMDGTLLNSERKISEGNIEAIKYAQSKGVEVVVATGRDFTEAIEPLKEAGIRLPLICVNGAERRNANGDIESKTPLTYDLYSKMKAILKEEEVYYELYTEKGSYTENPKKGIDIVVNIMMSTGEFESYDEVMKLAEERFQEGAINLVSDYEEILKDNVEIYKLLAFSENDESRMRAKEKLEDLGEVTVSASASENLEITHLDATKGEALKSLAETLKVPLEETMALGDNLNDISMLEVVGTPVAMANGVREVKDISSFTTDENTADGVAKAIYKVLGKE
ncbi:Cof-type HAD-IIB family hydrolase [Alteribacter aurantiacus]|uniref:Cof-type HAD-IIB family hydrolase n=1 Tax=Alteribacter aurantiacus TaxID=254410 RepID=UPI00041FE013|nr:Cof-type HAD-IIB family hydrolase [Alteribacter aurantiacus]